MKIWKFNTFGKHFYQSQKWHEYGDFSALSKTAQNNEMRSYHVIWYDAHNGDAYLPSSRCDAEPNAQIQVDKSLVVVVENEPDSWFVGYDIIQ